MGNSFIDLIIRIKNGYLAKNEIIESPHSRFKEEILKLLKDIGFIKDFQTEGEIKKRFIIKLFYKNKRPALTDIKIISKPGQHQYVSYKDLKPVLGGLGYSVLSTPQGILTDKQAKKKKVGGELLFNIW